MSDKIETPSDNAEAQKLEKESFTEMRKLFTQFKDLDKKREDEVKKYGDALGETKASIDKVQDRLDQLDVQLQKVASFEAADKQASDMITIDREHRNAWKAYARKGEQIAPEIREVLEQKTSLTVGDDTQAGYLTDKEYVREIIKDIVEISPIRSIARVRSTSKKAIQIPRRTAPLTSEWVEEEGSSTEDTSLKYGLEQVYTHMQRAFKAASKELLMDSEFNIEQELREEYAEQFAKAEGSAFVSGDGNGKPEGFIVDSDVSGVTATGTANTLDNADDLIILLTELKEGYWANASFVFNRRTLRAIRNLKTSQGEYLLERSLAAGIPRQLLGRPYVLAEDMPDIATGAKPVACGDFRRGYLVVDRMSMELLRDPFTQAQNALIRLFGFKRVGGKVIQPEAIKLLTIN